MGKYETITAKQVEFIEKLKGERVHGALYVQTQLNSYGIESVNELTRAGASNIIGVLLLEPKVEKALETAFTAPKKVTVNAEGLYRNAEGQYIKVVRSKNSGNLYAKRLQYAQGDKKGSFVYEPGLIFTIEPHQKVTLEEGLKFSGKIGFCCMCGRTLTAKASVEAGIGPICSSKF
jgi:hypothetical protein